MSKSIVTIFKELAVGFGEDSVYEACQTYIKQHKKEKKPRKKSGWQNFIQQVFAEMKKTNPKAKYMDAVKEASRRKKIQEALDKFNKLPSLPKSRGTTEGRRTEPSSEYPSDTEGSDSGLPKSLTEIDVDRVD